MERLFSAMSLHSCSDRTLVAGWGRGSPSAGEDAELWGHRPRSMCQDILFREG